MKYKQINVNCVHLLQLASDVDSFENDFTHTTLACLSYDAHASCAYCDCYTKLTESC